MDKELDINEVTEEEKKYLSELMQHFDVDATVQTNTPFMIRFRKCDFDWDRFYRMHLDTDTRLPSLCEELLKAIRIPFDDLPLYINEEEGRVKDISFKSMVTARLKLGR